ncbi:SDR family oxidoreductase [Terracidiphilus gabretensis]|uniref:SDR family oxidoreductase n=1 Tax=Terracidiphilus gabretensis TaxID=1577687 RepID=UPI00071B17FD|nr:aldehyde reductase [Terracidiphilus gabretensis]
MSKVLVTGGSGFIAAHTILQLLEAGHEVRTTVRNLKREPDVRAMLKQGGLDVNVADSKRLTFAAADLLDDIGWPEAVAGCEFVHHIASPFPSTVPTDENELIKPAREGAVRVLRAARNAGVKRVVLTSSFAAIGYGHTEAKATYTEEDWSDPNGPGIQAYPKSKTLAERAAWDFIAKEGNGLELAVVNPVGVFGPALGPDYSTSILIVKMLMERALPGLPRIHFGVVDVRDVADMHLRAMTHPAAAGQRFLAVSGNFASMQQIALMLKQGLGERAAKVPTMQLPDWLLRVSSLMDPRVKGVLPELGKHKNATSAKAQGMLGWKPRSREEAVVTTALSLIELNLLKK